jgi:hypothetical protein
MQVIEARSTNADTGIGFKRRGEHIQHVFSSSHESKTPTAEVFKKLMAKLHFNFSRKSS